MAAANYMDIKLNKVTPSELEFSFEYLNPGDGFIVEILVDYKSIYKDYFLARRLTSSWCLVARGQSEGKS